MATRSVMSAVSPFAAALALAAKEGPPPIARDGQIRRGTPADGSFSASWTPPSSRPGTRVRGSTADRRPDRRGGERTHVPPPPRKPGLARSCCCCSCSGPWWPRIPLLSPVQLAAGLSLPTARSGADLPDHAIPWRTLGLDGRRLRPFWGAAPGPGPRGHARPVGRYGQREVRFRDSSPQHRGNQRLGLSCPGVPFVARSPVRGHRRGGRHARRVDAGAGTGTGRERRAIERIATGAPAGPDAGGPGRERRRCPSWSRGRAQRVRPGAGGSDRTCRGRRQHEMLLAGWRYRCRHPSVAGRRTEPTSHRPAGTHDRQGFGPARTDRHGRRLAAKAVDRKTRRCSADSEHPGETPGGAVRPVLNSAGTTPS